MSPVVESTMASNSKSIKAARDRNDRVKYSSAWVTSLPVNRDSVVEIAACGRARWKIETKPST